MDGEARADLEAGPAPEGILPFSAHRVELSPGVWTIGEHGDDPRLAASTRVLLDALGGDLRGKRVLDVGCLEGGYTVTFARLGAREAVGLEIRETNLRRCRFLAERLRLANVRFVKGDARELSSAQLGVFDAIFAAGILYHLADPYAFLERCFEVCSDVLVLDTHVASERGWSHGCSERMVEREWRGRRYAGREALEDMEGLPVEEIEALNWAAWGHTVAFWPTEPSLVDMLRDVGFEYVSKVFMRRPYRCDEGCPWDCRSIYVARKRWPPVPAA